MLSSKKKEAAQVSVNSINVIGQDTIVEGNIISKGDIRIDGQLIGAIKTASKLVLGPSGRIEGDMEAKSADVSGEIKGNVTVTEVLFLKPSSKVYGDIKTGKLVVEAGGEFNGKCIMGGNAIPIASRSTTPASNQNQEAVAQ